MNAKLRVGLFDYKDFKVGRNPYLLVDCEEYKKHTGNIV